jgi:hypothetical protein
VLCDGEVSAMEEIRQGRLYSRLDGSIAGNVLYIPSASVQWEC